MSVGALLVRWFGDATPGETRSPEQTVDAFYAALQANDAALALSVLTPDATVFELGKIDRSRRDYAANHLPADIAIATRGKRELLSRRRGEGGDLRWVASTYRETGRSDATQSNVLAETAILRQAGDRWQIVHLHWSIDAPAPSAK